MTNHSEAHQASEQVMYSKGCIMMKKLELIGGIVLILLFMLTGIGDGYQWQSILPPDIGDGLEVEADIEIKYEAGDDLFLDLERKIWGD